MTHLTSFGPVFVIHGYYLAYLVNLDLNENKKHQLLVFKKTKKRKRLLTWCPNDVRHIVWARFCHPRVLHRIFSQSGPKWKQKTLVRVKKNPKKKEDLCTWSPNDVSCIIWAHFWHPRVLLPPLHAQWPRHLLLQPCPSPVAVVGGVEHDCCWGKDMGGRVRWWRLLNVTNVTVGFIKPVTRNFENPYPYCGCGFSQVRAWVALGNPRVAHDNPYLLLPLQIFNPALTWFWC